MNKVIFLDRDGVINREIGNYVYNLNDFVINDGLEQALVIWGREGYSFVIVSNQGGIAKELYHKNDVEDINVFLRNWFESRKLNLLNILYCPHHNAVEHCICRKPKIGLVLKAKKKYKISLKKSFVIGDRWSDMELGKKLNCKTIFIDYNYKEKKPKYFNYKINKPEEIKKICMI